MTVYPELSGSADLIEEKERPSPMQLYFNRELSWIEFNRRVLDEARDTHNPLLERVKFLSIFASNLDEFFMIRVSGIKQQISAGVQKPSPDGLTPNEQMAAIRRALLPLIEAERELLMRDLLPQLASQGIYLLDYPQLNEPQRAYLSDYFDRRIFAVLTPLAYDTSRPFPFISNLSLNLGVVLIDRQRGELFARVKIPEVLPRLIQLPNELIAANDAIPPERRYAFVWLEQVIEASLVKLFPGMEIVEAYPFRVTRDADMEIEEDEADDLLSTIEEGVRQRRFGVVTRLTVEDLMPEHMRQLLITNLKISSSDLYTVHGPLGLSSLMSLMSVDRPDLKDAPFTPLTHPALAKQLNIFDAIRQGDILLHHPYQSFAPVIDFIQAAAEDPNVLAIKQTLYRVGSNSPIVRALMHARENGKQVTAVVELKARFDEENNINWAKAMESVGVHVVFGLLGLKVHAKLALIVRQEHDGIRCYVHLGTGNYNASTARIYTDVGLFTCRPDITADVVELFNFLTAYSRQRSYRKLLVAPVTLRARIVEMIQREARQHKQHGGGHIIMKMNSLVDSQMIDELYRAAQEGVRIDLIVRGMCSLRPGLPGLSETISVRSIVGRFLEHHRIYYFYNQGNEEIYCGSADLMERNLDRRVEELFPLEDPALLRYVRDTLLETFLRDNSRARVLLPDGKYQRLSPGPDEPAIDSQNWNQIKPLP